MLGGDNPSNPAEGNLQGEGEQRGAGGMKRRRFLKHAALAAGTAAAGSVRAWSFLGEREREQDGGTSSKGGWPMFRGSRRLTGRSSMAGELERAPGIAWSYQIEAREVWEVIDPKPGRQAEPVRIELHNVLQNYSSSRDSRAWGLGPQLVDLYGTGDLMPDPGRAAKLIPGMAGLQTVEFEPIVDRSAAGKGQAVFPPTQAVCYAHERQTKREVWRSQPYDTIQNTECCIADIDGDGKLEVAIEDRKSTRLNSSHM